MFYPEEPKTKHKIRTNKIVFPNLHASLERTLINPNRNFAINVLANLN